MAWIIDQLFPKEGFIHGILPVGSSGPQHNWVFIDILSLVKPCLSQEYLAIHDCRWATVGGPVKNLYCETEDSNGY